MVINIGNRLRKSPKRKLGIYIDTHTHIYVRILYPLLERQKLRMSIYYIKFHLDDNAIGSAIILECV